MRAGTETIELGVRVSRVLTMENSGPRRRRIWWIVSSAVLNLGALLKLRQAARWAGGIPLREGGSALPWAQGS